MSMDLFAEFDQMFDLQGLKEDIEKAASNTPKERVKVPHGDYEVSIAKFELGKNTYEQSTDFGCPQINVWFKVVAGEYKDNLIFWSTNLNGKGDGFKLDKIKKFAATLETGIEWDFESFTQFGALLKQYFEAVDGKAEYQLSYATNAKGFNEYNIIQRF